MSLFARVTFCGGGRTLCGRLSTMRSSPMLLQGGLQHQQWRGMAGKSGKNKNDNDLILDILQTVRTIAMVGASDNPSRPSHDVMKFLLEKGYRVIPVNPIVAAKNGKILGISAISSLSELKDSDKVDMVDIFRKSSEAGAVMDEAIANHIPVIWTQLGVVDHEGTKRAKEFGATVVVDKCPKIEFQTHFGNATSVDDF